MKYNPLGKGAKSFGNKYLALAVIALSFFTTELTAQVYQTNAQYGYQWRRTKTDSTNHIPTFCGVPTLRNSVVTKQAAIAYDSCNKRFYFYDPKLLAWDTIVGGGGGAATGVTSFNSRTGSVLPVKSDYSPYLVDTLKRSNDSVYARVNNEWRFQYKDSTGGASLDTTNRFVNNVTSINDSTIRVWKGTGNSDLLIRGSGGGGGSGWGLTGNAGTNSATNFLGTTDNQNLSIRVNNISKALFTPTSFSFGNLSGLTGAYWQKIDSAGLSFNLNGTYIQRLTYGGAMPSGATFAGSFTPMGGGAGTNSATIATPQVYTAAITSGFINSQYEALTLKSTKFVTGESMIFNNSYSSQPKRMIIYATEGTVAITPSAEGSLVVGGEHASAQASSQFTVVSSTKGMLMPRMTTVQRNAITSPATGLVIWNTTDSTLNEYRGVSGWSALRAVTTDAVYFSDTVTTIATKTDVYNARPYAVLTQLLSQTTTDAPVEITLENTTGETFAWSYTNVGVYKITSSSALFTQNKIAVFFTNSTSSSSGYTFNYRWLSLTEIEIEVSDGGAPSNGIMDKSTFEIRIYP